MNLSIKPLTPELADDYFDFFDNRAFSDRKGAFCYCTWFHFDCSIEKHYEQGKEAMQKQAAVHIAKGSLNGYLAYINGISIGWCNADNRNNYQRIKAHPLIFDDNKQKIKAVVCFAISPDYRGKGIATALLQKVIEDAKIENYYAIEVYPQLHDKRESFDYAGPIRLYEKAGFTIISEKDGKAVMRKELLNA